MSRHHATILEFHMVWITKYRRKTIVPKIAQIVNDCLRKKADDLGLRITALKIDVDHIHIMFFSPPTLSISQVAKHFKGFTSREINKALKIENKPFWARGYFCCTVGYTAEHLVQKYILEHDEVG